MPATVLDRLTALVVIDLQKGLQQYPCVHPFADIVSNTARLAAAFRQAKLPVVLVTVEFSPDGGDRIQTRTEAPARMPAKLPDGFSDVVDELAGNERDIRVVKRQPSAFYGTDLDLQLRRRGVTGIVLTGVATSIGVDYTARAAHERNYNITFAKDAMTDLDPTSHDFALGKSFPRLGETDTTDAILALLSQSRGRP